MTGTLYSPGAASKYKPTPSDDVSILVIVTIPVLVLYPVAAKAFRPSTLLKSSAYFELNTVLPYWPIVIVT